jgi:hypothetical protein
MPLHLRLFAGDGNGRRADGSDSELDLAGTRSVWPCRCVPVGLEAAQLNGRESTRWRGGVAVGGAEASCRMGGVPKALAGAGQSGLKFSNLSGDP